MKEPRPTRRRAFGRLGRPTRLSEQCWPEGTAPVLSICCVTFNHAAFVAQAIESFLMQETTFPVEILIYDDASTDGTAGLIRDYRARYPKLIHATLQTENQFSKGERPGWSLRAQARGMFVAICEGDDYWTHPGKLELQVNYLVDHPEAVLSFHDVISIDLYGNRLSNSKISAVKRNAQRKILQSYYHISNALIPTLSVVYANHPALKDVSITGLLNGDEYLFALLSTYGEMHDMGIVMGAHRQHPGGVWTSLSETDRVLSRIKTLRAIATGMGASVAIPATVKLAMVCGKGTGVCIRQGKTDLIWFFGLQYLRTLGSCLCFLEKGPRMIVAVIEAEVRILLVPVYCLFMVLIGRRNGKNSF